MVQCNLGSEETWLTGSESRLETLRDLDQRGSFCREEFEGRLSKIHLSSENRDGREEYEMMMMIQYWFSPLDQQPFFSSFFLVIIFFRSRENEKKVIVSLLSSISTVLESRSSETCESLGERNSQGETSWT